MKYWGFLAAKLVVGAAVMYGIWIAIQAWYPFPAYYIDNRRELFLHDLPWTTLMFVYNLVLQGVLFLIILTRNTAAAHAGAGCACPLRKVPTRT